ncbi:MAG: hypothetical protein K2X68_09875 [Novosphingobium sp.]|nr:hypothetical protein [Novosphingobium sp.]
MFIGHYAPAFIAATHRNAPPLGVLMVGTQLIDFGFFSFALLGIEHFRMVPGITASNWLDLYDMPYTHSLLGTCVWAAGFAALVWLFTRRPVAAGLAAMAVVSHWLVDLLVHRPDLTLAGAPPLLGFGLWNWPLIEKPLELAIAFGGLAFYAARMRPKGLPLAVLAVVLALCQAIDWFGPRSTEVTVSQPITALAAYTVIAVLAVWVQSTRQNRPS